MSHPMNKRCILILTALTGLFSSVKATNAADSSPSKWYYFIG